MTDKRFITPKELKHRIETTSYEETIELYKTNILDSALNNINLEARLEFAEVFSKVKFSGDFYFLMEKLLGSSEGPRAKVTDELGKKSILMLLVSVGTGYLDTDIGLYDWDNNLCMFHDLVINKKGLLISFSQEEYLQIRDLVVMVIENFLPDLSENETVKLLKSVDNPEHDVIDNIEITLPY